jgi:membrane protein YdbS with pleckstrin-like domain
MKIVGLAFAIGILVAYKFLWPWTPFWADLIVIVISFFLYIFSVKSRDARNDDR